MKTFRFLFLLLSVSLLPRLSIAETVALKNGDILQGKIKTTQFCLHTSYGGIQVATSDIKMVSRREDDPEQFTILTLNNDSFSGALLLDMVDFQPYSGENQRIALRRIEKIIFTYHGVSKTIDTSIFFMKNGDKFSGELLNKNLRILTRDHETHRYQRTLLSRIAFNQTDSFMVSALLNDGTRVVGKLLEDRLRVKPFQ